MFIRKVITRALLIVFVLAAIATPVAHANHDVPVLPDVFPKIRTILNPLASQPAIVQDGDSLLVELDPGAVNPSQLEDVTATLSPSFGAVRESRDLQLTDTSPDLDSTLWPDRTVHSLTFSIPNFDDSFVEDLYDLSVTFGSETDTQHRAVKVIDSYPEEPTFAVIADPSVGDPRPVQDGAEELSESGSPEPLIEKTTKTIGNPMEEDRWAALGKAIEEINLLDPDFVLVAGDLTFLLYPRPANIEYEDAYRILSRLRVPTYLSPGNHDLYDLDYDDLDRPHTSDGKQLWPLYFGPLHYSVDVGQDLHLVSINTFDWADDQREALNEGDEFSTRAGGQIDDEQFDWLEEDLTAYRERNPSGDIITFAHHDPSWIRARHPWPGKNRLETRELLAQLKIGVHFAGHTHEDRVARYHEGNIVETNGRSGAPQELHYVLPDNSRDDSRTQDELGTLLRDPANGPLFVTTTTVSSALRGSDWGLGGYWGYRFGVLEHTEVAEPEEVQDPNGCSDRPPPKGQPSEGPPRGCRIPPDQPDDQAGPAGFDPIHFGYPATREFLDERAERPEKWNPEHAVFGVFSYPSYYLNASTEDANDGSEPTSSIHISNDLLVDVEIEVLLSVAGSGADVDGGSIVWQRTSSGSTDVRVRVSIPSGSDVTLTATSR